MARTPVKDEKPNREPVTAAVIAIAADIVAEIDPIINDIDDDRHEKITTRTPIPTSIDDDGRRKCAREECTVVFVPLSKAFGTNQHHDQTEHYCSSECAIAAHWKRNGLGPVPEKITRGVELSARVAVKQEKQRARAEHSAASEQKYGPLRRVVEEIKKGKGSRRVKYECGHEGSIGSRALQGRCRKCRPENLVAESPKPKRQPVKAEKPKRTPVKPSKRGKKGAKR